MFTLKIETKNEAFYPPAEFGTRDIGLVNRVMANEIDMIIQDATEQIRHGCKNGVCFDSNNKIVGSWSLDS